MGKNIFIPSKKFFFIFGAILLIILGLSLPSLFMNMFNVSSLDEGMVVSIGWPEVFFEIDIMNMESMPIKWKELILSFLGYFIISYVLDILISLAFRGSKKPPFSEELMTQARKAYYHYKSQGMDDEKIAKLFKQHGWKDKDIEFLKK